MIETASITDHEGRITSTIGKDIAMAIDIRIVNGDRFASPQIELYAESSAARAFFADKFGKGAVGVTMSKTGFSEFLQVTRKLGLRVD